MRAGGAKLIFASLIMFTIVSCIGGGSQRFNAKPVRLDSFLGLTNVRILVNGALVVYSRGAKDEYNHVLLGSPATPYKGEFPVFIGLPDSRSLDLSSPAAVDVIRSFQSGPPDPLNVSLRWDHSDPSVPGQTTYWPEGTERLQLNEYIFYVKGRSLLGFAIHTNSSRTRDLAEAAVPRIGGTADDLSPVPFSGARYYRMFGEPTGIFETFSM